jgi:hypothetical protein
MGALFRTILVLVLLPTVLFAAELKSPYLTPIEPIPREEPQVIRDLKAAGILVTITAPPENGDQDFNRKLKIFYQVLNSKRLQLLERKNLFSQLDITYFNHFDSFNQILSMSVNADSAILDQYLRLFDRRIRFEKETGVILDLGIETFANNQGLDDLAKALDQIFLLKTKIIAKKNILNRLFVDDFYSYKVSDKFLFVERDQLKQQLENFLDRSFLVSDFVQFANQIGMKVSGDLDFAIRPADFTEVINNLLQVKPELEFLVKTNALSEIELNFREGLPVYRPKEKLVELGNSEPAILSLVKSIKALSLQYSFSVSWNKSIDSSYFATLDLNYIKAIDRVRKFSPLIAQKLEKFKSIKFSDKTSVENEILKISINESDEEFEKIISKIN